MVNFKGGDQYTQAQREHDGRLQAKIFTVQEDGACNSNEFTFDWLVTAKFYFVTM